MATNKMRPIHPGEILREEYLAPLDMSAHALAMELRVPAPRINDIVRERRTVTPDTALRLARYFGTTAQFWLNLQSSFDLRQAQGELGSKIDQEAGTNTAGLTLKYLASFPAKVALILRLPVRMAERLLCGTILAKSLCFRPCISIR